MKKLPDQSIHLSNNSSSTTFTSDAHVRNLGVTFDPHLFFYNHISNLSRSCFMHIRDLRRIRPMLDSKTASTMVTSSKHMSAEVNALEESNISIVSREGKTFLLRRTW